MKLFRIEFKNEGKYIKEYDITLDSMTTYNKIEINNEFNLEVISQLFEKFKQDSKILYEDGPGKNDSI